MGFLCKAVLREVNMEINLVHKFLFNLYHQKALCQSSLYRTVQPTANRRRKFNLYQQHKKYDNGQTNLHLPLV